MYSTGSEPLDDAIRALIEQAGGSDQSDLLQEIVTTAVKLARDQAERGDLKIINSALKEMRYAFKVFRPYRRTRKVSVFGSARIQPHDAAYELTAQFAAEIAKREWMIISGAGPGIMQAAIDGAGHENAFGVSIRLPFESASSLIESDPKLINFKYFFTRKLMFAKESHAIVMLPGGFGTLDEAFETLTLVQTGKSHMVPFVLLEPPGSEYWSRFSAFVAEDLEARGLISPEDTGLYSRYDNVDDAVEEVCGFYRSYHSMRYVGDQLVLRVQHRPSEALLAELNEQFASITVGEEGGFRSAKPLPQEKNEPELAHLPRIVCRFDRHGFGQLRRAIDLINQHAKQEDATPTDPTVPPMSTPDLD